MTKTRGRRMKPSSGYIGSGNKTSVFTRRSTPPFSKIKEVYGDQFQQLRKAGSLPTQELDEEQRLNLKRKVRASIIANRKKRMLAIALSILILSILMSIMFYLMKS